MEILQTIWTALTTKNELMIKIINIPFAFIEMYVSMLLFTTILNIEVNKKQKLLYVIILGLLGLITSWTIPVPYNTFINIIACPILVFFLFKTTILKSILAEIIPYIVFVLLGSITINLYTIFASVSTNEIVNIPINKFIFSFVMYMCSYLICLFFKHSNLNITLIDKFGKKNSRVLLVNFCIGIIAICIQSYLATFYNDYLPFYITLASVLVLLIYFLISL